MQCLSNDPGNDDCFSQVTDVLAVEDAIAVLVVSTGTKRLAPYCKPFPIRANGVGWVRQQANKAIWYTGQRDVDLTSIRCCPSQMLTQSCKYACEYVTLAALLLLVRL